MARESRQDAAGAVCAVPEDQAADTGVSPPPGASGPATVDVPRRPPGDAPPAPSGLPQGEAAKPMKVFKSMPSFSDAEIWMTETSEAAVSRAEKSFDGKAEEIFRTAQKMLEEIGEQQSRAQQHLEEEVRRCQDVNRRLEEQRTSIEQMVQQMQAQLSVAESAAQMQRFGGAALAPPGLPGWRMPMPPAPMPGQWPGAGPSWPGMPTLSESPMLSDAALADFVGRQAGGGTGGCIGDDQAVPPVLSLLSLLGSQNGEGGPAEARRAWTASEPKEQPGSSSRREMTPPPKVTVCDLSRLGEEDEEDGIRTPPGLSSPNRAKDDRFSSPPRSKAAGEDVPHHLRSPKAKPRPVPEEYSEVSTPGLKSPGGRGLHSTAYNDLFGSPMPPRVAANATPQRPGTPGDARRDRCPGTPNRNSELLSTPKRPPRSSGLGNSTPMKSPVPASPFVICEGGGCVFGFMLRLAEGVDLGVDVEHGDAPDQALHVTGIVPGSAIDAWNKQCVGGPGAGKVVCPGDKIVAVNGVSESEKMLQECREKQMLRLTVVRGDPDCTIPAPWMPAGGRRLAPAGPGQLAASALKLMAPPGAPGQEVPFFGSPMPQMPPRSPLLQAHASLFAPQADAAPSA